MKGKRLSHEDILKLSNNTKVLIVENNKAKIHTLKFDDSLLYKLYDENYDYFTQYNVIKNFLQVYEYIPDKQLNNQENLIDYDKEYEGWEIVKMINQNILRKGDKYIRLPYINPRTNNEIGKDDFIVGDSIMPNIESLAVAKFKTIKSKEYLTFDEARKTNKKFKYKNWNDYMNLPDVLEELFYSFSKDTINKMLDEKTWEIEE